MNAAPKAYLRDWKPRILAVANQKGGVGKTTTAINLGTALAAIGEKVLILDLDPQGNASTGLGIPQKNRQSNSYDVLTRRSRIVDVQQETAVPRLLIVPAALDLLSFEVQYADDTSRTVKLRDALDEFVKEFDANTYYSYVLIDCPPSLNLLTLNAFAAANAVIVPLQCEFFALEGLAQLLDTIEGVRNSLNTNLYIHGIVLTMYDPRNTFSTQIVADVRASMTNMVYETVIPRNVRVSEAPSHGKPALLYDLKCAGSQAYLKLASEVIQRERRFVTV